MEMPPHTQVRPSASYLIRTTGIMSSVIAGVAVMVYVTVMVSISCYPRVDWVDAATPISQ